MGQWHPAPFRIRLPVISLTVLLLEACSTHATQSSVCDGQQLIITFTAGVDVTDRAFDAGLSHSAGIRLDYMRYLFDDHHLYCAAQEKTPIELDAATQRLRKRADIRAVEIDRIKHPAFGK